MIQVLVSHDTTTCGNDTHFSVLYPHGRNDVVRVANALERRDISIVYIHGSPVSESSPRLRHAGLTMYVHPAYLRLHRAGLLHLVHPIAQCGLDRFVQYLYKALYGYGNIAPRA